MIQIKKTKSTNPSTKELGWVFRPANVKATTISDVAEQMALTTTHSKGETVAVMTDFVPNLINALLSNQKVTISDLGTFELKLSSGWKAEKGDLAKTDVTFGINFKPCKSLKNKLAGIESDQIAVVASESLEESEEETGRDD